MGECGRQLCGVAATEEKVIARRVYERKTVRPRRDRLHRRHFRGGGELASRLLQGSLRSARDLHEKGAADSAWGRLDRDAGPDTGVSLSDLLQGRQPFERGPQVRAARRRIDGERRGVRRGRKAERVLAEHLAGLRNDLLPPPVRRAWRDHRFHLRQKYSADLVSS